MGQPNYFITDIALKTPYASYHVVRSSLLITEGYYMVTMLLIEKPILVILMTSNTICFTHNLVTKYLITKPLEQRFAYIIYRPHI